MSDILVAPFSNSHIRDWPLERYRALIGLLLDRVAPDLRVQVIGAPSQTLRGCEVVRPYPADRVVNACGRLSWTQVVEALRSAACVIGNNSGIGHLSGHLGVPTVCVFGGAHQRHEWRPLGRSVILVSRVIGCSPCNFDHNSGSPYDKACLREIEPETVANAVMAAMARGRVGGVDQAGAPLSPA